MMGRSPSFFLCIGLSLLVVSSSAFAQSRQNAPKTETSQPQTTLPTTEIFMNTLGTCAVGMNMKISANMKGSVKEFYEGRRTEGSAWLENAPDLLKLFPDGDKIVAYRLYVDCILKIVGAPKEQANVPKKETCVSVFLECAADLKKGDKSSAQSCKRYVECDPDNAKAHISLAEALIETKDTAAANTSIERARTLEPNNASVIAVGYAEQARSAIREKRYRDAQRYIMSSIEYDVKTNNKKSLGRDYATLGYVEAHLGNYPSARRVFEKSIALLQQTDHKGSLARSYWLYGRALARTGERSTGCAYMTKARALLNQTNDAHGLDIVEQSLDRRC
jgi:tetratricopeptide (TPR) repeat protein